MRIIGVILPHPNFSRTSGSESLLKNSGCEVEDFAEKSEKFLRTPSIKRANVINQDKEERGKRFKNENTFLSDEGALENKMDLEQQIESAITDVTGLFTKYQAPIYGLNLDLRDPSLTIDPYENLRVEVVTSQDGLIAISVGESSQAGKVGDAFASRICPRLHNLPIYASLDFVVNILDLERPGYTLSVMGEARTQ